MQNDFKTFIIGGTTAATVIAEAGHNSYLHTILVPKATVGTITVANNNASPVTQFTFPAVTVAGTYIFDTILGDGLTIALSSASDYVVATGYQY